MLHEPDRHEALAAIVWDESRVRDVIARIAIDADRSFSPDTYWPLHPLDFDPGEDANQIATPLYFGAAGVIWALEYLRALGAAPPSDQPLADLDLLLTRNRDWLRSGGRRDFGSYMMGDAPILLMAYGRRPSAELADRLAALIEGQLDHPARELMWGSPGTLLAASFLHERTGDGRWAELFRRTAATLWDRLEWSDEHGCRFWTQDLYGRQSRYLDAVHGFVATASPLIRGRHLLDAATWQRWAACIVETVMRTASREGDKVNWRAELDEPPAGRRKWLMQFCHGAPGFVICLGDLPGDEIDLLLLAAGRTIWAAGPLVKGSNLCHGTGGNGYALLKLHRRTGDPLWLERARAFAMHGIAQTEACAARQGRMRHSLWTGDMGFAIFLWDCLHAQARFPTLDVFYAEPSAPSPPSRRSRPR